MSQKRVEFVLESTNIIELRGLKDEVTGEYLEDATVVVTILDANGDEVVDAIDIQMTHVDGTTGRGVIYRGSLPETLDITAGSYTAKVVATSDDESVRTFPIGMDAVELP